MARSSYYNNIIDTQILSKESFITPACSNVTKEFSSVLMGVDDLVKAIKYKNIFYILRKSNRVV